MKNLMKQYLGSEYTSNHLKNFCLYWMKGIACRKDYATYDEWRKENDLDCMYFDGDMRADTLMSAWSPIKWVADFLNQENGKKFYKPTSKNNFDISDLKLLAEDRDAFLPAKHELVKILDEFLELAEQRCNFILLPDRKMNSARYKSFVNGKEVWFFDEVPAMLYHIFDKDSLGRYFSDNESVKNWLTDQHLTMGFQNDDHPCQENIIPLTSWLKPEEAKWFTEEDEIREALQYMIIFLKMRQNYFIDKVENKELIKPENLSCNALWDLYLILLNLPKPYIYADISRHIYPNEKLYRFSDVKLKLKNTEFDNDNSGWELPSDKHEGIEMELVSLPDGKTIKFEISVNALYDYKKPMGRIMSNGWRHVRIPTEEELIREGVVID